MPQIVQYFAKERAAVGGGVRASAEAFGAGIGRAVQDVGAAIGDVADIQRGREREQEARLIKQRQREATDETTSKLSELQLGGLNGLDNPQSVTEDNNLFADTWSDNFDTELERLKGEATSDLAKAAITSGALDIKTRLQAKANKHQATTKINTQKGNAIQSADKITNSMLLDPGGFDVYKDQINVLTASSARFMSPDERATFARNSNNDLYAARVSAEINANPQFAKQLMASEDFQENIESRTFESLNVKADREIIRRQTQVLKADQERVKLFTEDPAKLAVLDGAKTPDDIVATQIALGVREGNISVIPNAAAGFIANQLNGVTNADDMISELRDIRQEYGENYDIAMKDVKKGGLSDQLSFIAMMDPELDKQIMDASFAMGQDGADIKKKATARDGVTISKIEDKVTENILDAMEAIAFENPAGEAQTASMLANMVGIATFFVSQGQDIDSATELATGWFNNKTPVGDVNGKQFRIADGYTADGLEIALEDALDKAEFLGGKFENNAIKREGRFVLHPDGQKYYLKNGINAVVQDKDGEVMFFPVVQIMTERQEKLRKRRAKLTQEQLEKLQGKD